jgi:hypothetical protein
MNEMNVELVSYQKVWKVVDGNDVYTAIEYTDELNPGVIYFEVFDREEREVSDEVRHRILMAIRDTS